MKRLETLTELPSQTQFLRLARPIKTTRALGPGLLASVWFHGCSRNCPGCIAYEMNHADPYEYITPEDLAIRITKMNDISGVVLSGGEPLDQPSEALLHFLQVLRKSNREYSVVCYTGYLLHDLRKHPARMQQILEEIDLLIDGPYKEKLNDGLIWRGSSNQTLHLLSPRLAQYVAKAEHHYDRKVEISINEGNVVITGIPPAGYMKRLVNILNAKGIKYEL